MDIFEAPYPGKTEDLEYDNNNKENKDGKENYEGKLYIMNANKHINIKKMNLIVIPQTTTLLPKEKLKLEIP